MGDAPGEELRIEESKIQVSRVPFKLYICTV